jgi:hypothetical protein
MLWFTSRINTRTICACVTDCLCCFMWPRDVNLTNLRNYFSLCMCWVFIKSLRPCIRENLASSILWSLLHLLVFSLLVDGVFCYVWWCFAIVILNWRTQHSLAEPRDEVLIGQAITSRRALVYSINGLYSNSSMKVSSCSILKLQFAFMTSLMAVAYIWNQELVSQAQNCGFVFNLTLCNVWHMTIVG